MSRLNTFQLPSSSDIFSNPRLGTLSSDDYSQENIESELAAEPSLKAPVNKNYFHDGRKILEQNECALGCLITVITI